MVHAHGNDIAVGIPFQIQCQVILKTSKAKLSATDELSIDTVFGMFKNTDKLNRHELVFLRRVEPEMFSIPADAAGCETIAAAIFRAKRPFDAPVVRHIQ